VNRTVRRGARSSNTRGCPSPRLRLLTSTEIARVLREAAKPAGVCGCGEGLHRGHRFCSRCGRRARRPDADRAWSKLYSALELADCSVQHLGRVNGPGRVDEFRHCPVCGVRLQVHRPGTPRHAYQSARPHGEHAGGPVRIAMEALHRHGGVPPGWRLRIPPGDPNAGREAFAGLECFTSAGPGRAAPVTSGTSGRSPSRAAGRAGR
jgi:hypothetical protein